METQTTTQTTTPPTVETTATETPKTEEVVASAPVVAPEETPASPDVAVSVDGVEVAVTDAKGEAELSPATGFVVVLVLGLLAFAVVKLRGKK